VYAFLELGGVGIFFFQFDNPNRKLMEKLGRTKSGSPWVLFYRHPDEIAEWIKDAGFSDIELSVDRWNMYIMCTGRKVNQS